MTISRRDNFVPEGRVVLLKRVNSGEAGFVSGDVYEARIRFQAELKLKYLSRSTFFRSPRSKNLSPGRVSRASGPGKKAAGLGRPAATVILRFVTVRSRRVPRPRQRLSGHGRDACRMIRPKTFSLLPIPRPWSKDDLPPRRGRSGPSGTGWAPGPRPGDSGRGPD